MLRSEASLGVSIFVWLLVVNKKFSNEFLNA